MKAWIIAVTLMFLPMPALAQAQLTQADIQRLQDSVYDASADVTRLRQRDARLAEGLERELDDLRDEVIYLKVKMRKSGATRAEYRTCATASIGFAARRAATRRPHRLRQREGPPSKKRSARRRFLSAPSSMYGSSRA